MTREIGLFNIKYDDIGRFGLLNNVIPEMQPLESAPAPLGTALKVLRPLRMLRSPYLFIETANPEWTAFFSGYKLGSMAFTLLIARRKHVEGWRSFASYLHTSCQFQYCADGEARTVGAISDYGKWEFRASGPVAPFEDTTAYTARKIKDRLTPQMVDAYAAQLGLPISDEAFYCGRSTLMREVGGSS